MRVANPLEYTKVCKVCCQQSVPMRSCYQLLLVANLPATTLNSYLCPASWLLWLTLLA